MKNSQQRSFRIGLILGPEQVIETWQALLIDRLSGDSRIKLVGKIHGSAQRGDPPLPIAMRVVLAAEQAVVQRLIQPYDIDRAAQVLFNLPEMNDRAEENDVVDIILALGSAALEPNQLGFATFGEWSLSFAGATKPSWAIANSDIFTAPYVSVEIIVRTAENPAPAVLRQTRYNPKPGAILTGGLIAEKSVLFMHHALINLNKKQLLTGSDIAPSERPSPPGFIAALQYAGAFFSATVSKLIDERRIANGRATEIWGMAYGAGAVADFHPSQTTKLPARRFIMADPFLFRHRDQTWVFYEAMNANSKNGWIEVAPLVNGQLEPSVIALERPYHLSFPYVFSADGEVYMMPETNQSDRLEVWKATEFPTEWALHSTAFEGEKLAESSLFCDDGQWWLFTNISEHHAFQDHSSELYLFAVDGPDFKKITPHPLNPVVFGADTARNAGAVFRHQGRLFRPSQNNSYGVYGYGLNLMEILRLDDSGYEERLVKQFTPADLPGSIGLHHFSVTGEQFIIDWKGQR